MRWALLGLFLATLYVGSLVLFPLEEVRVEGLRHLQKEEVLRALRLAPGDPWLWALPQRAAALKGNPWVAEVRLERPRIGAVRVVLRERKPLLPLADGSALSEDGVVLPGGARFAPGPKVVGRGPLPKEALLALARAYPEARRLRYTPAGFWVELPEATLFAPSAELLLKYAQAPRPKGQVFLYSWGVSQRP